MIFLGGLLVGLVCLLLQALSSMLAARYFRRRVRHPLGEQAALMIFFQFSVLMILLMLGNVLQILIWALVYQLLDAFQDFETAAYFSGVTFLTLGYGDLTLPKHIRMVGVLQSANGVMMLGMTTSVFVAAVQHAVAEREADRTHRSALPGGPA
jgi:hypothetical protein